MDIFSIGLPGLIFILFLVVIIFDPKDLEKMGRTIGIGLSYLAAIGQKDRKNETQ